MARRAIIYLLDFRPMGGKCYVGQTVRTLKQRLAMHRWCAKTGDKAVNRAWRKYGEPEARVLLVCEASEANRYEVAMIELHGTFGRGGYNLTAGGEGGKVVSEATRAKLSAIAKARGGRPHTEESKRRISEANRERKGTELARQVMDKARAANKPWTDERKAAASAARTGKKRSAESKRRMAEAQRLRWAKWREQRDASK